MNYRMVFYLTGKIMCLGAALLAAPLAAAVIYGENTVMAFLLSAAAFLAVGICGILLKPKKKEFYARDGIITVSLSWVLFSLLGGLPFFISREIPNFADCFFETVSGFTTTGSSILTNVEGLSKCMLFWRSFTHWIGGMGVLVFAMALFSSKDTQTNYLMRAEMPGPKIGKLVAKWQFSARILYIMYIVLTAVEVVFLMIGKMPFYDSLLHAFGTAGTGGFSMKNTSMGYYNSAYIDYVIGIFMVLFGINFNIYYLVIIRKFSKIVGNDELKAYLAIVVAATAVIMLNIRPMYGSFAKALQYSFFQVSSIITTTGYSTADFNTWPMLSQIILVLLMFVGGCAGSTGGGLKVIRVLVLAKGSFRELHRAVRPRKVNIVRIDGKTLEAEVMSGVMSYFALYMLIMAVSILIVSLDNFDIATTATAVISTFNNIGPGLGAVGPTGSFADFSILSKLVLSFDMLAGRLEIYPMMALLMPSVWKRV